MLGLFMLASILIFGWFSLRKINWQSVTGTYFPRTARLIDNRRINGLVQQTLTQFSSQDILKELEKEYSGFHAEKSDDGWIVNLHLASSKPSRTSSDDNQDWPVFVHFMFDNRPKLIDSKSSFWESRVDTSALKNPNHPATQKLYQVALTAVRLSYSLDMQKFVTALLHEVEYLAKVQKA